MSKLKIFLIISLIVLSTISSGCSYYKVGDSLNNRIIILETIDDGRGLTYIGVDRITKIEYFCGRDGHIYSPVYGNDDKIVHFAGDIPLREQ